MATLDELEKRLAAVEECMAEIKRDAALARVLAGGADQDVTLLGQEIAAHTRVLSAMRKTECAGAPDAGHPEDCTATLAAGLTDIARLLRELIDRQ